MAAPGESQCLQEFIASVDKTCLPRILQVCSGVYFQGSVYELSGSEVCLSTGDLIKVIDIELQSISCEDISNNDKFELPITHGGLFQLVVEEMPYSTVEEMVSLRPVGLDSCLPFTFTSHRELTIENFTLRAGSAVTMLSVEQHKGGEGHVRCHIKGPQGTSTEVRIPLSCRGEFHECESGERFTAQQIVCSPHLSSRMFRLTKPACGGTLVLSPIYEVQAIMDLRKNIVRFPSSLEVDVIDVTEQCKDVTFATPLTLTEALSQPDAAFPAMVEIIEGPESPPLFHCSWLTELCKGRRLVLHGKGTSTLVLVSSMKGRKARQYFLVSQQYGGWLRRRPREFGSVYELHVAASRAPSLRVSVTRQTEEIEEESLPALGVGEQLEVLHSKRVELAGRGDKGQKQSTEVLVCRRLRELDDDDDDDDDDDEADVEKRDESEELMLPLYMQGHFVEKITDKKKHKLKDLVNVLPLDVKVVSRDTELEMDPLVGFPSLTLEEVTLEPVIQASLQGSPQRCFDIPTRWLPMSISFTSDPLPWPAGQPPKRHLDTVTEVTDSFYCEFRKKSDSGGPPPPRPPKRKPSSSSRKSSQKGSSPKDLPDLPTKPGILATGLKNLALVNKKWPPSPPPPSISADPTPPVRPKKPMAGVKTVKALPNTYVKRDDSKKKAVFCDVQADVDIDHDYESVDEVLIDMVKKAQQNSVLFY